MLRMRTAGLKDKGMIIVDDDIVKVSLGALFSENNFYIPEMSLHTGLGIIIFLYMCFCRTS